MSRIVLSIFTFLALIQVGCGDLRPNVFQRQLDVVGPIATQTNFVYLHRTFGELFFVTPELQAGDVVHSLDRVKVGARPLDLIVSPDGGLVLVINAGDQTLSVVDVTNMAESRLELPSDYDTLTVSPDGRFVVAHYVDAQAGGAGDMVFRNQNEITIFDLNPNEATGGQRLSQVDRHVMSLRSSPLGFQFAPPFTIQGSERRILVVRSESALTLVDMTAEHEADRQRRIFFVLEDSTQRLIPQRILFSRDDIHDDYDMKMFVLASTSQEIFEVSILPPSSSSEQALSLSINQFPGGPSPVEMLSFEDYRGNQKLLILNGNNRRLMVVDVATGNSTEININWVVTRALTFKLTDSSTGYQQDWALLYSPGTSSTVLFVNLSVIEDQGLRAITSLVLDRPVGSINLVPGEFADKAVVVHSGSTALSVLDLNRRYAIPLPGSATLATAAFSANGDYLFSTVEERAVLAIIELENAHPSQIAIPEAGGRLAVLRRPQIILVDHMAEEGRMTLLNGVNPSMATARTINGLFLDNLFGFAEALAQE